MVLSAWVILQSERLTARSNQFSTWFLARMNALTIPFQRLMTMPLGKNSPVISLVQHATILSTLTLSQPSKAAM